MFPPPQRQLLTPDNDKLVGDFLNVRYGADGKIRLAHMKVWKADLGNCFEFVTKRGHTHGLRTGQGWFYKLGTKWIADGIVGEGGPDAGMRRLTILSECQRTKGASVGDMFGLRLTATPTSHVISAQKIFCCKIADPKAAAEVISRLEDAKETDLSEAQFRRDWPDFFEIVKNELIGSQQQTLAVIRDANDY